MNNNITSLEVMRTNGQSPQQSSQIKIVSHFDRSDKQTNTGVPEYNSFLQKQLKKKEKELRLSQGLEFSNNSNNSKNTTNNSINNKIKEAEFVLKIKSKIAQKKINSRKKGI